MSGRFSGSFTGIKDDEWDLLKGLLPKEPEKRRPGAPHAPFRLILNSIFFILITGARWCDLPDERTVFAARSTAHRWLIRWQEDGTFSRMRRSILIIADREKMIDWSRVSVDGSFSPWEGRRRRC